MDTPPPRSEATQEVPIKGMSKSRYLAGLQCPLLLYQKAHNPEIFPETDAFTQYRFDQGTAAGKLATTQYGGETIPAFPIEDSVELTKKAIEEGARYIFEAAFNFQGIHVKVDILVNHGDGHVDIIEVKSSTKVKDEHIDDLAFQRFVLEGNDFDVDSCILMHMNPDYRHPDGLLFTMSDESAAVDDKLPEIPEKLQAMRNALKAAEPPRIDIGPHCGKPYECALKPVCWAHIPELSIFNIPNLRNTKWEFYHDGIITIEQLPDWYKGKPYQQPFLESCRTGKPVVDKPGVKAMLDELTEPLYFMDFETMQLAVPQYNGTKPWQQLTVQWSVHVLKKGKLTHHEFIQGSAEDPRKPFIESLLKALGDKGSIIVYNATFERSRLEEIAEAFPEYTLQIVNVVSRLWDQLDVFKKFYCDAGFKGSNSLKSVLPVLVPKLSYKDLEVGEGGTAMVEYARMIALPEGEEKQQIMRNLLEYCKLDTLAMVEIHKVLSAI